MKTIIGLTSAGPGRPARATMRSGHLRPSIISLHPDRARIALVGLVAILLAGDAVEIEIDLGPGVHLDLVEVAGTVAYNGEGKVSSWRVTAKLAENASLRWHGQPFVVSDGANVERSLQFTLAATARLELRDTLVLGRTGEVGGVITNRTRIDYDNTPVLVEAQKLASRHDTYHAGTQFGVAREAPGMLQNYRVLDSYLRIPAMTSGENSGQDEAGAASGIEKYTAPEQPANDGIYHRFELPQGSEMWRYLGTSTAESPIGSLLN